MITVIGYFLAVIIVGLIALRKGADESVRRNNSLRWLLIAGYLLLGVQVAIYLAFGIGEMVGGEMSGAGHFVPVIAIAILGFLVWRRPLEGGVAMLLLGILDLLVFGLIAIIVTWPLPVAGALFTAAALLTHRTPLPGV